MLKRSFRLPSKVSFSREKAYPTPFFLIKIKKNTLSHARFGFVVSKRVSKIAVVRNKIKRTLAGAVQDNLLGEDGYDMLVVVKKSFLEENISIKEELTEAVQKFKENEKASS